MKLHLGISKNFLYFQYNNKQPNIDCHVYTWWDKPYLPFKGFSNVNNTYIGFIITEDDLSFYI